MQTNITHSEILNFINSYGEREYEYGRADNFLFIIGMISRICGRDLVSEFEGKYTDPNGLREILQNKISSVWTGNKEEKFRLLLWRLIFHYLQSLGFAHNDNINQSRTGDIAWISPCCHESKFCHWQTLCSQKKDNQGLTKDQTDSETTETVEIDQKAEECDKECVPEKAECSDYSISNYLYLSHHRRDPLLCVSVVCDTDFAMFTETGMMYMHYPWPKYYFWSLFSKSQSTIEG